jgi:hypothetical protein
VGGFERLLLGDGPAYDLIFITVVGLHFKWYNLYMHICVIFLKQFTIRNILRH